MSEFLKPDEIDTELSANPYIRAMQVANRIGLMGVRIEDIERTFPLGATDLLCAMHDIEEVQGRAVDLDTARDNVIEGENNGEDF